MLALSTLPRAIAWYLFMCFVSQGACQAVYLTQLHNIQLKKTVLFLYFMITQVVHLGPQFVCVRYESLQ